MPRFLVTTDCYPGIARDGVGFFIPGQILELPDKASRPGEYPNLRLVPLEKDALEALQLGAEALIDAEEKRRAELEPPRKLSEREKKEIRARVRPIPPDPASAQEAAAGPRGKDESFTVRQIAEGKAPLGAPPTKRAADR